MAAKQLHPDLDHDGFAHLFTVNGDHPEARNIGKFCRYINPSCIVENELFVIGSLQFNYRGELCYRVYRTGDTFGRVAGLNDVRILEVVVAA